MLTEAEQSFLSSTARAAQAAGHIFPAMAACEAALESTWGQSQLAVKANNLFGQKQQQHPIYGTLALPTREFINHAWVTQNADWIQFPALTDCFAARMDTLRRLAPEYPHYGLALSAKTADQYVQEVSLSWSTDPARAQKCIAIWQAHGPLLEAALSGDAASGAAKA